MAKSTLRSVAALYRAALLLAVLAVAASCTDSSTRHEAEAIQRIPVSSSAMKSVGYSETRQVLEIEFPNGTIYQYSDVPKSVYEGLMAAESHGRYFHRHIRGAGYPYTRTDF